MTATEDVTREGMRAFLTEAGGDGGTLDVTIVRPNLLLPLHAIERDRREPRARRTWARRTANAACAALDRVLAVLDQGAPLFCSCCDAEMRHPPPVFAIVTAHTAAPKEVIGIGLCAACAPPHPDEEPAKMAAATAIERFGSVIASRVDQPAAGRA